MIRPRDIKVGTSGWKFDDWAGVFYPFRVPQSKWLEYYSSRFPIGEINSTYYRIAGRATYAALVKKTPENFVFYCKVHGDVTHSPGDPTESMKRLLSATEPLISSGKLHGWLAQFPHSFSYSEANSERVVRIAELSGNVPLCVEFRHKSWELSAAVDVLREQGIVWVTPDEPAIGNLPSNTPRATTHRLYMRLHGRNAKTWYGRDAGDRYDYRYSTEELTAVGESLLHHEGTADSAVVLFNNCYHGQAVENAFWFQQWLEMMENRFSSQRGNNGLALPLD